MVERREGVIGAGIGEADSEDRGFPLHVYSNKKFSFKENE